MSDDETQYDVVFRGDVAPGENIAEVKQQLAQLFKANEERIEQLFSGRPMVLKRGVNKATANRYKESLGNAGAIVTIRPAVEVVAGAKVDLSPVEGFDFDVAEVGADVLAPEERRDLTPKEISTSHLSVAPTGEDVLRDEDKKPFVEKDVDTSHLSLDSEQDS